MSWTCVGVGVGLALLLAGPAGGADAAHPQDGGPGERKPVPLYTNEDLDRVSARRGETGVFESETVPGPADAGDAQVRSSAPRGEPYWRHEADRLRARLRPRRAHIEELRARIAEREAHPGLTRPHRAGRSGSGTATSASSRETQLAQWRARLAELEREVRDEEDRFEERARRAGALPGWLR